MDLDLYGHIDFVELLDWDILVGLAYWFGLEDLDLQFWNEVIYPF